MFHSAVCLFGDSVARGVVLEDSGSYALMKESFAELTARKLGISLTNKARFGCTIGKGMEILGKFLARREIGGTLVESGGGRADSGNSSADSGSAASADAAVMSNGLASDSAEALASSAPSSVVGPVALLEFGGNDCDFKWDEIAQSPEGEHLPATPLGMFSSIYDGMIAALRGKGYRPVLMTLPPIDPERYFDWVTRSGIDKSAVLAWLGDVKHIYWWHEGYNNAVWATALRNRTPVVDTRKAFLEQRDYRDYLCADGIHPNRNGHLLMETAVLEYAAAW